MKEIEFRGKPVNDEWWLEHLARFTSLEEWVTGNLVISGEECWIVGELVETDEDQFWPEFWVLVRPETVGQYTGLKDKNGVKIFEGDSVQRRAPIYKLGERAPSGEYLATGKVVWDESSFTEVGNYTVSTYDHLGNTTKTILFNGINGWYVIGNIHDNPELSGGI